MGDSALRVPESEAAELGRLARAFDRVRQIQAEAAEEKEAGGSGNRHVWVEVNFSAGRLVDVYVEHRERIEGKP